MSSSSAKAYAPRRWHICVLTVKMRFLMQAITAFNKGRLAERLNAPVLKTGVSETTS
jgi:hypothetical protein